jgi:hypothetical protein
LIQTKTTLKKLPKYFTLTLGVGLVSTCIAGFFFLQKVGGANSSQFLISLYLIGVLYAAISIEWIVKNISRKKAYVVGSIFILLASTRVIHNTYININNLSQGVGIFVNNTTLNSYQYFTKAKPGSTVLMYDETNCLFIRMLSDSFPYICPDGAPGDRGVTLSNRIEVKNTIFTGKDIEINRRLLHANKISYIYMPKKQVAGSTIEKMHLPKVFDNTTIAIYQVTN